MNDRTSSEVIEEYKDRLRRFNDGRNVLYFVEEHLPPGRQNHYPGVVIRQNTGGESGMVERIIVVPAVSDGDAIIYAARCVMVNATSVIMNTQEVTDSDIPRIAEVVAKQRHENPQSDIFWIDSPECRPGRIVL